MFYPNAIIKQLEANNDLFHLLLSNVTEEESLWKPSSNKWSILEIAAHLVYEETDDFRTRVELALKNSREKLSPIDPEGFIDNEDLSKTKLGTLLESFDGHRKMNIEFLEQYNDNVNSYWNNTLIHPQLGELSAKMLLTNWLVHDHLHIKQILTRKNQYIAFKTKQDIKYAGGF